MKNKFKALNGFVLAIILSTFLVACSSCGEECITTTPDSDAKENVDIIADYHSKHFPSKLVQKSEDSHAIYVDFSSGITKEALKKRSNLLLFKSLLSDFADQPDRKYFEVSEGEVTDVSSQTKKMSYFTKTGHKKSANEYKQNAPIDKAINLIVERDNVSILVTDGELASKDGLEEETWASDALKIWMNKGHKLSIVYSDFKEGDLNKHMYFMFFIPNNSQSSLLKDYIRNLKEDGIIPKVLNFSTNTQNLFERQYPDNQTPGSRKYLEYYTTVVDQYRVDDIAMEYIDMTNAEFSFGDNGLVNLLRDMGNDDGKPENYALFDKLYFQFNKLENYKVNSLNIVVHDISKDISNYKRNFLAREVQPIHNLYCCGERAGQDSLSENNKLTFKYVPIVDNAEAYDTSNVDQSDKANGFISILKQEFMYSIKDFNEDKGIQDFLLIDTEAGKSSEINDDEGKYEVIIRFDPKLNSLTNGLNTTCDNLFRIDVKINVTSVTPNKQALTWNKKNGDVDETLYKSLKNILNNKDVKPDGVVYSYYVKLGKFNDQ